MRRLNAHAIDIKRKEGGITPSTLVAMVGHQPTSVLDVLEDDSSHGSTSGPDDDAAEAIGRTCFVATPP